MATEVELFGISIRKVLWIPRLRSLSKVAVNLAIGHEHGAKLHFDGARKHGASEDEMWETIAYAVRAGRRRCETFPRTSWVRDSDLPP